MKIVIILAVLLLVSCTVNPGDPDALRAEAARIERATARAYAGTQAAQVEQNRQAQAARMATQGAAEIEIQAMNAQANATVSAITNQQAALDLALTAGQATREAWADNLRMTQTQAPVEATQTVRPTALAAAQIMAANKAEFSNLFPLLSNLIFLLLAVMSGILIVWVWRRSDVDIKERQLQNEIKDRINGTINNRIGIAVYRPDAKLIDRVPLDIPRIDNQSPYAPSIEEPVQADPKAFDLRERAIDLLERSIELNGETSNRVASWSALDISSESWQKTIEYLKTIALVYTIPNKGTYTRDGITLSDVIYRLEETSPTPLATVREREGAHG